MNIEFSEDDFKNERLTIMLSTAEKEAFLRMCNRLGITPSEGGRMILKLYMLNNEHWFELESSVSKLKEDRNDFLAIANRWFKRFAFERRMRKALIAFCKYENIQIPFNLLQTFSGTGEENRIHLVGDKPKGIESFLDRVVPQKLSNNKN